MDRIQLKQETLLDDNVVLSDINPITNTESVDDSVTGEKLSDTILRIWNAINNKLTRVVNSVNGRTGVVVLSSEDVGLGNVDNVSFSDIKQWVLDQITKELSSRSLRLYDSLAQVIEICATNDKSYVGSPFFCDIKDETDYRSYIGYYYWNESDGTLRHNELPISTIGETDGSIVYVKDSGSYNPNQMKIGGIGVNIHKDEEALKLYIGTSLSESGLRIDPNISRAKMYFFNSLYGTPDTNFWTEDPVPPIPGTELLALYPPMAADEGYPVKIYINNTQVVNDEDPDGYFYLSGYSHTLYPIGVGDIIVTNFGWYGYGPGTGSEQAAWTGASVDLMARQPGIGYVSACPSDFTPDAVYEIRFLATQQYVGYGLKYQLNHFPETGESSADHLFGSILSLNLNQYAGLNAVQGPDITNQIHPGQPLDPDRPSTFGTVEVQLPWEMINVSDEGLLITSDSSVSTYRYNDIATGGRKYVSEDGTIKFTGSSSIENYAYDATGNFTSDQKSAIGSHRTAWSHGVLRPYSKLSVNLNKIIGFGAQPPTGTKGYQLLKEAPSDWSTDWSTYFMKDSDDAYVTVGSVYSTEPEFVEDTFYSEYNLEQRRIMHDISGLRIVPWHQPSSSGTTNPNHVTGILEDLGIYDGKDAVGNTINDFMYSNESGGIRINTGKFLEICPVDTKYADEYHKGGKLQVRIGNGLKEDVTIEQITIAPSDWFTNIDSYLISADNGATFLPIPMTNILTEYQPAQWVDVYTSYGTLDGDTYVENPLQATPPEWVENTYYFRRHFTFSEVTSGAVPYTVYKIQTTNRITLNLDSQTLAFDEDGKLTVIGGVGGGNIRLIDSRGCYFDTSDQTDSDIDEVVRLGPGLRIIGGNVPADITLGTSSLRSYLSELIASMSTSDAWEYMHLFSNPSATSTSLSALIGVVSSLNTQITSADFTTLTTIHESINAAQAAAKQDVHANTSEWIGRMYLTETPSELIERLNRLGTVVNEKSNASELFGFWNTYYGLTGSANITTFQSNVPTMTIIDTSLTSIFKLDWAFSTFLERIQSW